MTGTPFDYFWPLSSLLAMVPVVFLLAYACETIRYLREHHLNGERRLLARADVRRGMIYTLVLVGNTATGTASALGLLPVYPLTAVYATIGSALFGLEAWFEVLDLKRLKRERGRRDRRRGDPPG